MSEAHVGGSMVGIGDSVILSIESLIVGVVGSDLGVGGLVGGSSSKCTHQYACKKIPQADPPQQLQLLWWFFQSRSISFVSVQKLSGPMTKTTINQTALAQNT